MGQLCIGGETILVDDADLALVQSWKWHIHRTGLKRYARGYPGGIRRSEARLTYMHRMLLSADRGDEVDHRDGNGLNNERGNLRLCTRAQNNANRSTVMSVTSQFKGVHFEAWSGKWRAEIQHERRRFKLGRFATEEEALAAYMAKAKEFFGEFARMAQANSK
jgi:hypothetical protein